MIDIQQAKIPKVDNLIKKAKKRFSLEFDQQVSKISFLVVSM